MLSKKSEQSKTGSRLERMDSARQTSHIRQTHWREGDKYTRAYA